MCYCLATPLGDLNTGSCTSLTDFRPQAKLWRDLASRHFHSYGNCNDLVSASSRMRCTMMPRCFCRAADGAGSKFACTGAAGRG